MVEAYGLRVCDMNVSDEQNVIRELRSTLEPEIQDVEQIQCRKLTINEAQKLADKLEKRLLTRGIRCDLEAPTHTRIRFRRCVLTTEFIEKYGRSVSGFSGRRTRYLGWDDWVDFQETVNDVFDENHISTTVTSQGGGGFVIRKGLERNRDYEDTNKYYHNVGSMMKPVYLGEAYVSEKRGRQGFIQDEMIKRGKRIERKLIRIRDELPDVVIVEGEEFKKIFYSADEFETEKYPRRSREIMWEDKHGNEILLVENNIEYISKNKYERGD